MVVPAASSVIVSLNLEVSHRRHVLPIAISLSSGRQDGEGLPVILFSHGDGLTGEDYAPLVDGWTAHGFAVIRPTHLTQRGLARLGPADPKRARLWRDRVDDMRAVIDGLDRIAQCLPDAAFDRSRIFVAGHSFGGHTASLLLGARITPAPIAPAPIAGAAAEDFSDPRIKAGILLAPPGAGGKGDLTPEWRVRAPYLDLDWSAMRAPVLTVVGTADIGPMAIRDWTWRADPYWRSMGGNKTLLTLIGADHYLGGIALGRGIGDPVTLACVRNATAAYLAEKAFEGNSEWQALSGLLRDASPEKLRLQQR